MAVFRAKVRTLISANIAKTVSYNENTKTWNMQNKKTLRCLVEEVIPFGLTITIKLKKDTKDVLEIHNELEGPHSKISSLQMAQRAEHFAGHMQNCGIGVGDVVVIVSHMARDVTPIFIACLLMGIVFSPCPVDLSEEDMARMLAQLNPKAIFFDDRFRRKILNAIDRDELIMFNPLGTEADSVSKILFIRPINPLVRPNLGLQNGEKAACKLFSRGNLITITQGQLRKAVMNWDSFRKDDVILIGCSISKVNHLTLILKSVMFGVTRIETGFAVNEEIYCNLIRQHKVTRFYSCVSIIWGMINLTQKNEDFDGCLRSLRTIITLDEFFPTKLEDYIYDCIPKCRISSTYSVTEAASVLASSHTMLSGKVINGGRIQSHLYYRILDDNMQAQNPGENGVLCIKYISGNDFVGFAHDSNIESKKDISKKSLTIDGWLVTGDYARLNLNGILEVFGKYSRNILCDGVLVSFFDCLRNLSLSGPTE